MKAKSLNCEVGDIVHYHYKGEDYIDDFDFEVSAIEHIEGITRVFSKDKGCIVYEEDFQKHCKVIKSVDQKRQMLIDNEDLCDSWNDYYDKLEKFKSTYKCEPSITRR